MLEKESDHKLWVIDQSGMRISGERCSLEKKNEVIKANKDFQIVISYNPGYQSVLKD